MRIVLLAVARVRKIETLKRTRWKPRGHEGVVELAKFIPEALLNGIGAEPMGHAGLEDLYYVIAERNELLGTFLQFIPVRKTDRSIEIISLWLHQQVYTLGLEISLLRIASIQPSRNENFSLRLC